MCLNDSREYIRVSISNLKTKDSQVDTDKAMQSGERCVPKLAISEMSSQQEDLWFGGHQPHNVKPGQSLVFQANQHQSSPHQIQHPEGTRKTRLTEIPELLSIKKTENRKLFKY